ncbi:MAG: secondary thiamine-phosphate synthase enzyme YjbQ [Spirochaetaceae bacterium]|jgi:secondary thiamine-phosphate synthase enzyme|nr:secondary thiamine-phosphate synthase enzyme YjbQ [Spirochaetaceae bacterium]
MSLFTLTQPTSGQTQFIDISQKVQDLIEKESIKEGSVLVYCPHTTAGLTINENADPDVQIDMLKELNKIVPFKDGYRHMEGNSAAHIKASLMGFSLQIPITGGRMILGTWQGIYFCEFDGPRTRKICVKISADR